MEDIDLELVEKPSQYSSLITEGSNDVLTMTLGTPEHSGRVRGLGFGVVPTRYFNLPKRGSKRHITELEYELREAKKRLKDMEAQLKLRNVPVAAAPTAAPRAEKVASYMRESENINSSSSGGKIATQSLSSKFPDSGVTYSETLLPQSVAAMKSKKPSSITSDKSTKQVSSSKVRECRLAIGNKTNIVAEGIVFDRNGPNEKIHNIALGENNVRVSISKVISSSAILSIPVPSEMYFVKEAIGSYVAWPKELVLGFENEMEVRKKAGHEKEKDIFGESRCDIVNKNVDCDLITAFTHNLNIMKTNQITIPLEKEMFGEDKGQCYVFKNDLLDFCALKPLDVTCIVAYMRFLYDKFQCSREEFQFFNPESFNGTKKFGLTRLIGKRLGNAKKSQICFIAYNLEDIGKHIEHRWEKA